MLNFLLIFCFPVTSLLLLLPLLLYFDFCVNCMMTLGWQITYNVRRLLFQLKPKTEANFQLDWNLTKDQKRKKLRELLLNPKGGLFQKLCPFPFFAVLPEMYNRKKRIEYGMFVSKDDSLLSPWVPPSRDLRPSIWSQFRPVDVTLYDLLYDHEPLSQGQLSILPQTQHENFRGICIYKVPFFYRKRKEKNWGVLKHKTFWT